MIYRENIYNNLKELVATPSISGTTDEVKAAQEIDKLIKNIPYFTKHPENVKLIPINNDPYNRALTTAFLPSKSGRKDTVILTGHYDVVDIEEYGTLKNVAFDMEEITKRINELPLDDEAKIDFESGEYLFGRGTLDMKYGHALAIELLRHYSESQEFDGNLLYVGVCGEETNSEGMLAAVPFFVDFAKEHDLHYNALLLMEGYVKENQSDKTRLIHHGNFGKVMPTFFCIGKVTHGDEPLLGLDANILSANVYLKMAENPDFCQINHGIATALPCGLKLADLNVGYALSTTLYSASYYNLPTLKSNPKEILEHMKQLATEAFTDSISLIEKRAAKYSEFAGKDFKEMNVFLPEPVVLNFQEFFEAIKKEYSGDFDAFVKSALKKHMEEDAMLQDACIRTLKDLAEISTDKRPKILVGFIPPCYPDVNADLTDSDTSKLFSYLEELITYAKENYNEDVKLSEYYGISDMCLTWPSKEMDYDTLFKNLIGVNSVYDFPIDYLKQFKVPSIVLGAAGKDFHKYTERLEKHYNLDVLPELYCYLIDKIL